MIVFINDILVYYENEADNVRNLRVTLQKLRDEHLHMKFSKYDFWLDFVSFFGLVMTKGGIMIDPPNVVVVYVWGRLTSPIENWRYVKLVLYYCLCRDSFPLWLI